MTGQVAHKTLTNPRKGRGGVHRKAASEIRGEAKPQAAKLPPPVKDVEGNVTVDKRRFPSLYAAVERGAKTYRKIREQWTRVSKLRSLGHHDKADRLSRMLLGIKGKEMSEETKAVLHAWRENHAEEIKERAEAQKLVRLRTRELTKPKRKNKKRTAWTLVR